MGELVSRGLVALWAVCVFLRCFAGEVRQWGATHRRPLTSSAPRGLEWRAIRPIGNRVLAVRLQVVIA